MMYFDTFGDGFQLLPVVQFVKVIVMEEFSACFMSREEF